MAKKPKPPIVPPVEPKWAKAGLTCKWYALEWECAGCRWVFVSPPAGMYKGTEKYLCQTCVRGTEARGRPAGDKATEAQKRYRRNVGKSVFKNNQRRKKA